MKRLFVAGKVTLGLAMVLASAGGRLRAADDLPKAETILDRAVEVTGGKDAYAKIHTEVTSGTMELSGMKGSSLSYKAAPDKVYTEITLQGIGKMTDGSNGTVAWSNSAIQGPHVKEGEEKDHAMLLAQFDSTAGWRK